MPKVLMLAMALLALPAAVAASPLNVSDLPGDVYVDYGQDAYHVAPSTKVSWFTTVPVVIAQATVVEAPPVSFGYAGETVPPPMVKAVAVYEDSIH